MVRTTTIQSKDSKAHPSGIFLPDPSLRQWGELLAEQTGLPIVSNRKGCKIMLLLSASGLSLWTPNNPLLTGAVQVDFTTSAWNRRLKRVREERLIKAMGKHRQLPVGVTDATGGLGRDSFLLAAAGFQVQVFEQNPILAALLADGLRRGLAEKHIAEVCRRINFIPGNAVNGLNSETEPVDIIYIDPMFPASSSTAKVKKELQMIQLVTGKDGNKNMTELFALSLQTAAKRVVVKRPLKAPPLDKRTPSYSLNGKTIRFDIYLT